MVAAHFPEGAEISILALGPIQVLFNENSISKEIITLLP
jgi:hypothetical protein